MAQGTGRSRGGRGRKVHAAADHRGRALRIEITGAQTHDSKAFGAFIGWKKQPAVIVDDKAYGSKAIRQAIAEEGALAVIPSRSNAGIHIPHDPDIHAQRNLVEWFFCRMKDMRRLTTGYEKLKRNFLSMVHIFAIRCWLNRAHTLAEVLQQQAATFIMDVIGVTVNSGADGDHRFEGFGPPCRHLQAVKATLGNTHHANISVVPGLCRRLGNHLAGILQFLRQIFIFQQAFRLTTAAHVCADTGIVMAGHLGMGELIADNRTVAFAIGQMLQNHRHRMGPPRSPASRPSPKGGSHRAFQCPNPRAR